MIKFCRLFIQKLKFQIMLYFRSKVFDQLKPSKVTLVLLKNYKFTFIG